MDDYGFPDDGCFGYAQPFDTFSVPDHYAESYNYATIDPIAIMLRQQREDDEQPMLDAAQCMPEVEPIPAWLHASSQAYAYAPDYESTGGKASGEAAAKEALRRVDDPDTPHSYSAAKAAGHNYYYLPMSRPAGAGPYEVPAGATTRCGRRCFATRTSSLGT